MRLALFQPDIPQNTGTILRMGACLGIGVDIIEPCGFVWSDRYLRRAGMDYLDHADLVRHPSWEAFAETRAADHVRLILLTTSGSVPHTDFQFHADDILLLGRESAGVPSRVHAVADARIRIPLSAQMRSLNVAVAAAIVAGEALRQTKGYPEDIE